MEIVASSAYSVTHAHTIDQQLDYQFRSDFPSHALMIYTLVFQLMNKTAILLVTATTNIYLPVCE